MGKSQFFIGKSNIFLVCCAPNTEISRFRVGAVSWWSRWSRRFRRAFLGMVIQSLFNIYGWPSARNFGYPNLWTHPHFSCFTIDFTWTVSPKLLICEHGLVDTCENQRDVRMEIFWRIPNFHMAKDDGSALQCLKWGLLRLTIGSKVCSSRNRQTGICPVGEWSLEMWQCELMIIYLYIHSGS